MGDAPRPRGHSAVHKTIFRIFQNLQTGTLLRPSVVARKRWDHHPSEAEHSQAAKRISSEFRSLVGLYAHDANVAIPVGRRRDFC